MLVSCLLPTFNRYPFLNYLVEEAVECFLRQTWEDKELILLNDTPGQILRFSHPQVRVINTNFRYPTLGEKLHWMLTQAQGDYICRWDDDDLSLPWRLEMSALGVDYGSYREWRPENHWYDPRGGDLSITLHPGNTHIMAIWHRNIILDYPMTHYPGQPCASGLEDQTFNLFLRQLGFPQWGTILASQDIFYMYRWGTGSQHLSGRGGGQKMQQTYDSLATVIHPGEFEIKPRWHQDHVARTRVALAKLPVGV